MPRKPGGISRGRIWGIREADASAKNWFSLTLTVRRDKPAATSARKIGENVPSPRRALHGTPRRMAWFVPHKCWVVPYSG